MARVLLVDDDAGLLEVLGFAFKDAGHVVISAADGDAGWALLGSDGPDVVVSDVNLPGLDGFSLCRKARAAGLAVPIILLTSRDSDIDEALGLELGADDYVTKPFSTRVLLARVQALLRRDALRARAPDTAEGQPPLIVGRLVVDVDRVSVTWGGASIAVTVTELRLLEVLARRPGIVHSRAQLLDRIRGDESVVADRLVDTYVRRLRRKLEAVDVDFDAIETLVGAGYRWRSP
ncbi:MAG: response regulator transcription factor [Deltaproteobacteria bacterium]|nr:response regulator transcription factor [Deltaproteobacteria bacterium]